MICKNCNHPLEKDALFCDNCGAEVQNIEVYAENVEAETEQDVKERESMSFFTLSTVSLVLPSLLSLQITVNGINVFGLIAPIVSLVLSIMAFLKAKNTKKSMANLKV